MANLIIDSKTESVIVALQTEAAEAGDLEQVALCEKALAGDRDAYCECIRVVIQDGSANNWDLLDENNETIGDISDVERNTKLLESLTCGTAEGWVVLADGRRAYAQ